MSTTTNAKDVQGIQTFCPEALKESKNLKFMNADVNTDIYTIGKNHFNQKPDDNLIVHGESISNKFEYNLANDSNIKLGMRQAKDDNLHLTSNTHFEQKIHLGKETENDDELDQNNLNENITASFNTVAINPKKIQVIGSKTCKKADGEIMNDIERKPDDDSIPIVNNAEMIKLKKELKTRQVNFGNCKDDYAINFGENQVYI